MRIAVCSPEMDERYALSKLLEEALLRRGILPEVTLFPLLGELSLATAYQRDGFELAIVTGASDSTALVALCRRAPVILVGGKADGPAAFDMGAAYFLEAPVVGNDLDRALVRCLSKRNKEDAI